MKVVQGNNLIELSPEDFLDKTLRFPAVELDLGTGDGRYVYKSASETPNVLYIGVDPVQKQLEQYSKKALKDKLRNTLFVLGSAEMFPFQNPDILDSVNILFPWGTLLACVANPDGKLLNTLKLVMKNCAKLKLTFGYSPDSEPREVTRLSLGEIDDNYIKTNITPVLEKYGFLLTQFKHLERPEIKELESTWSKKLAFGKDRPIYYLEFQLSK